MSIVAVLSWKERINALVKVNAWTEALAVAFEFFEGRARAVIGLPDERNLREEVVRGHIASLLVSYLDVSLNIDSGVNDATIKVFFLQIILTFIAL